MATFVSNNFFRLISDGDKIVMLNEGGGKRECIEIINPILTTFQINARLPHYDIRAFDGAIERISTGLMDLTVDMQLRGGQVNCRDSPLIMGVDIFDKLSVTDYLDIINEKIKKR